MESKRVEWIDITKGMTMILVVIGHTISSYQEAGLYLDNVLYNFLYQFIYSFHMPLFMLLSGMLFKKVNKEKRTEKCLKLLVSYGIPYILFTFLWVGMKLILANYINNPISADALVKMFIYPVSFMWFIYTLLIIELLAVFFVPEDGKQKIAHLLVAWGGVLHETILS